MSSIYEITSAYLQISDMMEDPEMDPQLLADTMEAIDGELEVKAENYGKVLKNLEGDIAVLKAEEDRLKAKRQTIENNIRRMKAALQGAMEVTGKTKFKTDLFSFGIQQNAPSVVIDTEDIETLPPEFIKVKKEVDKVALKEVLLRGSEEEREKLNGYAHIERSNSLRIR